MDVIYVQLLEDYGAVTFEAFINLLVRVFMSPDGGVSISAIQVDIMEDQTSPEQLRDAFRGIANDKVRSSTEFWARLTTGSSGVCFRAGPAGCITPYWSDRVSAAGNASRFRWGWWIRLRGVAGSGFCMILHLLYGQVDL